MSDNSTGSWDSRPRARKPTNDIPPNSVPPRSPVGWFSPQRDDTEQEAPE